MNRRGFLGALLGGGLGALALDPERALWAPGKKLISVPPPPIRFLQHFVVIGVDHSSDGSDLKLWPSVAEKLRPERMNRLGWAKNVSQPLVVGDVVTFSGIYTRNPISSKVAEYRPVWACDPRSKPRLTTAG